MSDTTSHADTPLHLCYSYSHKDEEFREDLEKHLTLLQRQGLIAGWHDRMISAGDDWKSNIDEHFENADIVLLLVSANFLASEYCYEIEMRRAVERHDKGTATVIPIILKPVDNWHSAPFGKLQACPRDGKPVIKWRSRDEAFANVAMHIRQTVQTRQRATGVSDLVKVVSHTPAAYAEQSKALIASRRRCCMCWFWSADASIKSDGRTTSLAAVEGSSDAGFVYLCDRHAKQFVSNAITVAEVMHARNDLYKQMQSSLPTNTTSITFRVDRDFDDFSESEIHQFLSIIKALCGADSVIELVAKKRGSVRLTVNITADDGAHVVRDVRNIVDAAETGKLETQRVTDVLDIGLEYTLLAQVVAQQKGGGGVFASAYPIGRNLLLTAGHAVLPDDLDGSESIQIRWPYFLPASSNWRKADLLWHGGSRVDAALLRCTLPHGLDSRVVASSSLPTPGAGWTSASVAARDTIWLPLMGTVQPSFKGLLLTFAPEPIPSSRPAMQGVSGSPVFVNGRLVGVITSLASSGCISAVSFAELLEIPEFREISGYSKRIQHLQSLRESLSTLLNASPFVFEVLSQEIASRTPTQNPALEEVIDALVGMSLEECVDFMHSIAKKIDICGESVQVVRKMVCILLPLTCDWKNISQISEGIEANVSLISTPTATRTFAEIVMAGVDARPASFRLSHNALPSGALLLETPPETGIDRRAFIDAFEYNLIQSLVLPEVPKATDKETLLRVVEYQLAYLRKRWQRTYYFIVDPATDAACIDELKAKFPSLVFVETSGSPESYRRELRAIRTLHHILESE